MEIFNNTLVFIGEKSFKQNKQIATKLRKYVNEYIISKNITCIGGESYLYGMCNYYVNTIYHYTNSEYILNDSLHNDKFYRKIKSNNIINYNTITDINNSGTLIINTAKLNVNLVKVINEKIFDRIIVINCHHNDFWKKIKLLDNYKLVHRNKFITNQNFITVNIFIIKTQYISLGLSCAVANNLNKLGLRKEAYPFDWCKMNIRQLNNVLSNNFEDYEKINIKKFSESHKHILTDSGSFILKNKYNIIFAHEVLNSVNINIFSSKLLKRIDRFKKLKNIKFIMHCYNTKDTQKDLNNLITNLDKYFTNWQLTIITNYNFLTTNKVKVILMPNKYTFKNWQYSDLNWKLATI